MSTPEDAQETISVLKAVVDSQYTKADSAEIEDSFINGDIDFIQIKKDSPRWAELISAAIGYAIDTNHQAFTNHPFEGHDEDNVFEAAGRVQKSLKDGTHTIEIEVKNSKVTAFDKTVHNTNLQMIRIVSESEPTAKRKHLFDLIGRSKVLVNPVENGYDEDYEFNVGLFLDYVDHIGTTFALMAALSSGVKVDSLIEVLNNSYPAISFDSLMKMQATLVKVQKSVYTRNYYAVLSDSGVHDSSAKLLQSWIAGLGIDRRESDSIFIECMSNPVRFETTGVVVMSSMSRLMFKNLLAGNSTKEIRSYILSEENQNTLQSTPATIYLVDDQLPFTAEEYSSSKVLTSYSVEDIINYFNLLER